jgi:LysR substrate binding domain
LARLRQALPSVRPRLIELSSNEQLEALAEGAIDIGFAHPPLGTGERLDVREFPAVMSLAVLPDDGGTGPVTLAQVAACGLILFPSAQGPVLHARIMDTFTNAGVEVQIVQEATRALTMLSLVSAGLGAALLPESIRRVAFEGVRYAEIEDATLPKYLLVMIARRRAQLPVVRRVWQLFSEPSLWAVREHQTLNPRCLSNCLNRFESDATDHIVSGDADLIEPKARRHMGAMSQICDRVALRRANLSRSGQSGAAMQWAEGRILAGAHHPTGCLWARSYSADEGEAEKATPITGGHRLACRQQAFKAEEAGR